VKINGYNVSDMNGGNFKAENEKGIIFFLAEGREAGHYFKVTGYYDKQKNRRYNAQKYLYKFIIPTREISFFLADNNYLWDYVLQIPFLEARENEKRRINNQRIAEGKKPLYSMD
jgi:hypothetical protein